MCGQEGTVRLCVVAVRSSVGSFARARRARALGLYGAGDFRIWGKEEEGRFPCFVGSWALGQVVVIGKRKYRREKKRKKKELKKGWTAEFAFLCGLVGAMVN